MPRSASTVPLALQKLIPIEILSSSLARYHYLVDHSHFVHYRPYILSSRRWREISVNELLKQNTYETCPHNLIYMYAVDYLLGQIDVTESHEYISDLSAKRS